MFFRFSLPDQILSDQGRQFESAIINELCGLLQIQKSRTTPYHPQGDGLVVERSNRTLLNMLSIVVKDHPNTWESHLRAVCMAYNTSIHPTAGYSPFFLMFGRKARLPIDLVYGSNKPPSQTVGGFVSDTRTILEYAYRHVRDNMKLKQDRQKELYDRKRHGEFYNVGDLVWLHSSVVPRGASRKFHRPWTGPYKIVKKLADITYRIQNCREGCHRLVVHFDRLKPCPKDMRVKELTQSHNPHSETETELIRRPVTSPVIHDLDDNYDGEEISGNRQPTDRTELSINRARGASVVEGNASITDASGYSQLIDRSDNSTNGTEHSQSENSQPENSQPINRAQDALIAEDGNIPITDAQEQESQSINHDVRKPYLI